MTDRFIMSSRQAAELDHALERNGWTSADVKTATKGNTLAQFRKVLLGTATVVDNPVTKKKQSKLLVSDGHYAVVEVGERHDPGSLWQTRPGLYVYDDFRNRIVAAAKPTETGAKFKKLPRFKLGRNATGEELKGARPNGIWTATDFCPWLAAKLAKQAGGKDGEFLNNGWANLFLVEGVNGEVFVVVVGWFGGEWIVDAWRLDDDWPGGSQFGSRN
ncbi:hypothetical protein HYS79_01345 [Patescibacteria group bacterium]|nr:hypothetical protein [Patescibacteria group bacterium]